MKKLPLLIAGLAALLQSCTAQKTLQDGLFIHSDKYVGYLFAHMTKQDYGHLYYSVSKNGLHWQSLNDGRRIDDSYRGHPDITLGHDGRYYLLGGSRTVDIWVSDDLIKWQEFLKFDPDVTKTPDFKPIERIHGAPKMFYDPDTRQYLITWHTSQNKKSDFFEDYWSGQRTLYVTSKDLKTFTEPRRLFQYDMATIDVIIRKENDTYCAILKDERYPTFEWPTGKSIRIATSKNLTGPWSIPSAPITPCYREAPTLIPRLHRDGWYLYYEQYPGIQYGLATAPKIEGPWYDVYIMDYQVPEDARHGCMIPITQKQYDAITSAYPNTQTNDEQVVAASQNPNSPTSSFCSPTTGAVNLGGGSFTGQPQYEAIKTQLSQRLMQILTETNDLRVTEGGDTYDKPPYTE